MDNKPDGSTPIDTMQSIRARLEAERTSRVDSAVRAGQTDSTVLAEQSGINLAQADKDKSALQETKDVLSGVAETTLAAEIGEEVGQSLSDASSSLQQPNTTTLDVAGELFQLSRNYDDTWRPRSNDDQWKQIQDSITALGLEPKSNEAAFIAAAGSQKDLTDRFLEVKRTQEAMQEIAKGGKSSQAMYMGTSMVDADMFIGGGVFTKIKAAKKAKVLQDLQDAGKLSADEVAALNATRSRLDNTIDGATAGMVGAGVGEAGRVALSPSGDMENVYGAMLFGTALGSTVGAILPTQGRSKIVESLETNRVLRDLEGLVTPEIKDRTRALNFTERAEGGFADVAGDRGGATMQGISSKYWPDQYKELKRLVDSGNLSAAKKYRRKFYTENFYNKVVDNTMTSAQKQAMYDTSVLHGVGAAKKLYKQAGGDVNKLLQLREQYVRDIVAKDPSQEQFLDGWLNRIDDLSEDLRTGGDATRTARYQAAFDPERSVGAGTIDNGDEMAPAIQAIDDWADDVLDDNPALDAIYRRYEEGEYQEGLGEFVSSQSTGIERVSQQVGEKMLNGIRKTHLISDYDNAFFSSKIGRALAFKLYESPIGQVVNNRSADAIGVDLNKRAAAMYAPKVDPLMQQWARDTGSGKFSFMPKVRRQFGEEVSRYRAAVNAGRADELTDVHPAVKEASDDLDMAYEFILNESKAKGVEGFEDIEFTPGYVPRRWKQSKLDDIIREPGVTRASIINDLRTAIARKNSDLDPDSVNLLARAIMRHLDSNEPNPVGSLGNVNALGREQLENTLRDMGYNEETAGVSLRDRVDSILFTDSERGMAKRSRRRIDLDMTTPISGTQRTLLDLTDNDVYAITDQTVRGQANLAALASVGIQQRQRDMFIAAAKSDARINGKDPEKAAKAIDDMFGYFDETAFQAGNGRFGRRMNKLARLVYLPQLGVTQAAEIGVAMGVVGLRSYSRFAGKSIQESLKGTSGEMMDSIYGAGKYVADHREFVSFGDLDEIDINTSGKYIKLLDRAMDNGSRAMGYISGFYKANEYLHTWAAMSMNDYMVKAIRDGKLSRRLDSMGVDQEFRDIVKARIDDGSIKFDDEGYVADMGVENWTADERYLLRTVTRRNMDQTVQKPRRGDGHAWMYTEMGSLIGSLKSYVFTAAQKQLVRGLYHADAETAQTMLAGLVSAGLAYTAKQMINGNTENLDAKSIAVGAINWSSMLSPVMMAADPLAYVMGLDKVPGSPLPFNEWRYGASGLISVPGLNAINDFVNIGRLPADLLDFDGELDAKTEKGIKAIPVIGRSYPSTWIMETIEELDE